MLTCCDVINPLAKFLRDCLGEREKVCVCGGGGAKETVCVTERASKTQGLLVHVTGMQLQVEHWRFASFSSGGDFVKNSVRGLLIPLV